MNRAKLSFPLAVVLDSLGEEEAVPVIVTFRPGLELAKALPPTLAPSQPFRLTPHFACHATKKEITALSRHRGVIQIWRDAPVHTCLDVSVPLIGAPLVWEVGYRGRGVRVAIVDTGIDAEHPALRGRVAAIHDLTGEGPRDLNGHGTHVAGIVAGDGERYRGVAPEATLMAVKVLRGDGSGTTSQVMAGVEWAVQQGAQVINLSLGSSGTSDGTDPLSQTGDAAMARGIVVCVAAGNDGPRGGSIGSPGTARQVITVGASTDHDAVADFSSRGPTADERVKPDLVFPGYGIISCRARGTTMGRPIDDLYTEASGTSMATPHASGTVALLLQARPGLTPAQVKALFMKTAKSLGLTANVQGAGRAQANQAFRESPQPIPGPEPVPSPPRPPAPRGCLPSLLRLWPRSFRTAT